VKTLAQRAADRAEASTPRHVALVRSGSELAVAYGRTQQVGAKGGEYKIATVNARSAGLARRTQELFEVLFDVLGAEETTPAELLQMTLNRARAEWADAQASKGTTT
jgi:hypothetical protein